MVSSRGVQRVLRRCAKGSGCWVWGGAVDGFGYGRVMVEGVVGAHRVVWVWRHGEEPKGCLRNECGNRRCVNPAHWRDDGEKAVGVGEARQVEIERLWGLGLGIGEIAREVGCSRGTVWRRLKGKRDVAV